MTCRHRHAASIEDGANINRYVHIDQTQDTELQSSAEAGGSIDGDETAENETALLILWADYQSDMSKQARAHTEP